MAEVASVVVLVVDPETQRGHGGRGQPEGVDDVRHHRVEEALLRHSLQVREDGEELVLRSLVGLQRLLEVIEERRLPDPPLARDHEAVVVEDVHDPVEELAPAEEHVVGHDGGPGDVGVESAVQRPPPPRVLHDQTRSE